MSASLNSLLATASVSRVSLVSYGDRIEVSRTSCSCWRWLGVRALDAMRRWRNAKSATNALVENDNMLGTLLMNMSIKKAVYTGIGALIRHL